jgi:hypothetical protein
VSAGLSVGMSKIALDVESTLADSNEAALQSTDKLDREQILGEWEMDEYTWQVYMGVSDAIWRHKPEIIPPEEPCLDEYVQRLGKSNTVHILTGREHVDEQMMWWLEHHGIEYESFMSTCDDKTQYQEYDVFIDDNPRMVGSSCRLLLRHKPWNAHIDTGEYQLVDRIHSLAEASDFL